MNQNANNYKHGQSKTKTYQSWYSMKRRCNASEFTEHEILYEPDWEDFENFYRDMGDRPEGKTLCRIDPTKDYEPSNCYWGDYPKTRKKPTLNYTYNGETKHVSEWAKITGIKQATIVYRLVKCGWSVEDALTIPVKKWTAKPR